MERNQRTRLCSSLPKICDSKKRKSHRRQNRKGQLGLKSDVSPRHGRVTSQALGVQRHQIVAVAFFIETDLCLVRMNSIDFVRGTMISCRIDPNEDTKCEDDNQRRDKELTWSIVRHAT